MGGRYSALTAFGLVPSGLAGADIGRLLDEAAGIADALAADDDDNPGLRLGAPSGWPTGRRRDKVVLVDGETPIVGLRRLGRAARSPSPPASRAAASSRSSSRARRATNFDPNTPDEVLVSIGSGSPFDRVQPASGFGATVDAPLGAQMLLWEYAVAVAGRLIGINPFDQPDVESAKEAARGQLGGRAGTPDPAFSDGRGQRVRHRRPARRGHRHRGGRRGRPAGGARRRRTATWP